MNRDRGLLEALDLVIQRQRWQRDALRHASGLAHRRYEDAMAEGQRMQAIHREALAGQPDRGLALAPLDPRQSQARVDHLCVLADRLVAHAEHCEVLRRVHDEQQRLCGSSQRRLQSLEDQRERRRSSMVSRHLRLQAAMVAQDWQIQRQWTGLSGEGGVR